MRGEGKDLRGESTGLAGKVEDGDWKGMSRDSVWQAVQWGGAAAGTLRQLSGPPLLLVTYLW